MAILGIEQSLRLAVEKQQSSATDDARSVQNRLAERFRDDQTPSEAVTDAAASDDLAQSVFTERAKHLFRGTRIVLIGTVASGLLVLYAFWGTAPVPMMVLWFGCLCSLQAVHLALYEGHGNPDTAGNMPFLVKTSIITSLASGSLWGTTVLFLPPELGLLHQVLLLVVIAGMTTATVASSAAFASVSLAFNLPAILPLAFYFFFGISDAGNDHNVVGAVIVLYVGFLALLARHLEAAKVLDVEYRLNNARFVDEITGQRDQANAANQNLHVLLDTLSQGVVVYDKDLRLQAWSRAFAELFDIPDGWLRVGRGMDELIRFNAEHGEYGDGNPDQIVARRMTDLSMIVQDGIKPHRYERRRPDGRTIEIVGRPLPDGGLVTTYTDITALKQTASRAVERASNFDSLTGLPNRVQFLDKLRKVLIKEDPQEGLVSVTLIGLDRFKELNDSMGLSAGDEILTTIARRLKDFAFADDAVARLGNDEFGIIGLSDSDPASASRFVRDILAEISRPMRIDGRKLVITSTAGVSLYPIDSGDAAQLIHYSAIALNVAKVEGGQGFQLYDSQTHAEIKERSRLEHDMRIGIENRHFELYYQPLLDTATGATVAVETLMRWNNPKLGQISPARFIPLAEASGLIVPLTEWALPKACRQVREWDAQGLPAMTVAVNLSPVHFADNGLVELVSKTLDETGLEPERLELEITEGLLLQDKTDIMDLLGVLQKMGVRLVIDDFGTGYSSMSYLSQFPIHKLKIDRSFVSNLQKERGGETIVEALVNLAAGLGLEVIAEGVETEEQYKYLRGLGCDQVQGFLFSRPLPPDQFVEWLTQQQAGSAAAC